MTGHHKKKIKLKIKKFDLKKKKKIRIKKNKKKLKKNSRIKIKNKKKIIFFFKYKINK